MEIVGKSTKDKTGHSTQSNPRYMEVTYSFHDSHGFRSLYLDGTDGPRKPTIFAVWRRWILVC
jgi:hypothetical protein